MAVARLTFFEHYDISPGRVGWLSDRDSAFYLFRKFMEVAFLAKMLDDSGSFLGGDTNMPAHSSRETKNFL